VQIGLILDAYQPVINGITNFVSLHRRELERAGHTTTVFTWGRARPQDEPRVVRSPALLSLGATGYALGLRYTADAQRALAAMDVLHVHHPFLAGRLALRYARPRAIPILYTNHTRYDLYAAHYARLPRPLARRLVGAYLAWFCRRCDLVVAPAEGLRRVLQDLGVRAPIELIPNGVDLARFAPHGRDGGRAAARAALDLPAGDCVFVYTGRLGPEKNLVVLLGAFTAVRDAHLVLVGDGPAGQRLRRYARERGIADRVHFAGSVAYSDIPRYLAAADAFATASLSEVNPLSVTEALAAGLPVVAFGAPGMAELVAEGENGLLAAAGGGAAALAEELARLVAEPELRAELAGGAWRSRAALDIGRTSAAYLARYRQLAERRGARHLEPPG
jgi:glycosyltransferase involved in cell wall biosynthesis